MLHISAILFTSSCPALSPTLPYPGRSVLTSHCPWHFLSTALPGLWNLLYNITISFAQNLVHWNNLILSVMLFLTRPEASMKEGAMPLLLMVVSLWEVEYLLISTLFLAPQPPFPHFQGCWLTWPVSKAQIGTGSQFIKTHPHSCSSSTSFTCVTG